MRPDEHTRIPLTVKLRKKYATLSSAAGRHKEELFRAEGVHLVEEALSAGIDIEAIIIEEGKSFQEIEAQAREREIDIYTVAKEHQHLLFDTQTPQGVVAICSLFEREINTKGNLLIIDNVGDPGNVGTIIRTAEWFGVKNILLSKESADIFNPKVLRASMGSAFRCSCVRGDLVSFLDRRGSQYHIVASGLEASIALEDVKLPGSLPFALVVGNEARGISEELLASAHDIFRIGGGGAESLNVAVATGVALYYFTSKA